MAYALKQTLKVFGVIFILAAATSVFSQNIDSKTRIVGVVLLITGILFIVFSSFLKKAQMQIKKPDFPIDDCNFCDDYDDIGIDEIAEKLANKYYDHMDKIQKKWSVLYNLRAFQNDMAIEFEQSCKENIQEWVEYKSYCEKKGFLTEMAVHYVPAYVRLSMLYERQGRLLEAIQICVEAIQNGAYNDHNSSSMYGRLARLIKKSKIEPNEDIKAILLSEKK